MRAVLLLSAIALAACNDAASNFDPAQSASYCQPISSGQFSPSGDMTAGSFAGIKLTAYSNRGGDVSSVSRKLIAVDSGVSLKISASGQDYYIRTRKPTYLTLTPEGPLCGPQAEG